MQPYTQNLEVERQVGGKLTRLAERAMQSFSEVSWQANDVVSRAAGRVQGLATPESRAFERVPLTLGNVTPTTLARLQDVLLSAPEQEFRADDHAPGYIYNVGADAVTRIFRAGYRFRRIGAPQLREIAAALEEIAPQVTKKIGSGWRVINLKSWSIGRETVAEGPNAWHLDGFPAGTMKLMIYLTPVGTATGTTEVRYEDGSTQTLEGAAGTYLLFDPSALWHRGVAPSEPGNERTHVELTLMRMPFGTDLRLAEAGLNSSYPRLPWTRRPIRAV